MHPERLERQLAFIMELDRLKTVLRQTRLTDESRRENSAEHSWHLTLMALLLAEYADQQVDLPRAISMLLIHDIVEIDAGDTFAYDATGVLDQAAREGRAAERLFGLLPADQGAMFRGLWEEFEAHTTPEANFAVAMDRLQPLLMNVQAGGGTWLSHGITMPQILQRVRPIERASTPIWRYVQSLLERIDEAGYIPADPEGSAP